MKKIPLCRIRRSKLLHWGLLLSLWFGCVGGQAQEDAVERNRSAGALALYERMQELQEKGIMFGHQDSLLYGHDWKYDGEPDVKQVAGSYPGVFGWEIGDIGVGASESLDKIEFSRIRDGIVWAHERGGVNTISWHADNPLTGGDSWDTSSSEVVQSILPGGAKEAKFREMLERLAAFLLSLRDEEGELVPVVFRPYHEHTGSWFWWGEKLSSAEDYIALWRYTVGFLQERGATHLLYAYSPASNFGSADAYLERYPGDALIDILGFDAYQRGAGGERGYRKTVAAGLEILSAIGKEKGKLMVLAETGLESLPVGDWWTGTLWPTINAYPLSYVLVWRNAYDQKDHFYAPYPGQKSAEDFKAFEALPGTLFLKDIH